MHRKLQLPGNKSVTLKFINLLVDWVISLLGYSLRMAGFTLIELLISISVVALLLSVSFAGYAQLNQRQTLLSSGQNLKNIIRDAQTRSLSSEIDCNSCNCSSSGSTSFNGWSVDFTNKQIYGSCGVTPTVFSQKPFNLPAEIIITPFITPPASSLVFRNNPPSANSVTTVCVSDANLASTYYTIRVNTSGTISDDGGLTGACTP